MKHPKPIILGLAGPELTAEEASFFSQIAPFGFILFQRNCVSPDQVRQLTASLREVVNRDDLPIFIDQEGGRVARLKKDPCWPSLPALRHIGALYEKDQALGRKAMHLHSMMIAHMLHDVGVNGNCAPVLDLMIDGASEAIGDRALSSDPEVVTACGRIAVDTYLSCGVIPVVKHIPGHGRVRVDPHIDLPFVDVESGLLEDLDFYPFIHLNDAPIAMNCHVVFRSLDENAPVSLSKIVHENILRKKIGFEGLIFSDDLAMGALSLPLEVRASKALEAGADIVLYCSGILSDTQRVCLDIPMMGDACFLRWKRAQERLNKNIMPLNLETAMQRFNRLMDVAVTLAA